MIEMNYRTYVSLKKESEEFLKKSKKNLELILDCDIALKTEKTTKFQKIKPYFLNKKNSYIQQRKELYDSAIKDLNLLKNHIVEYEEQLQRVELSKNDENSLKELFDDINEKIEEMFNYLEPKKTINYSLYLITLKTYDENIKEIIHNLSLISNCVNGNLTNPEKLDFSKLKKIKHKNLKKGDVIIEYLSKSHSLKNSLISKFLGSPVIHTSIVLDKKKENTFILEAVSEKEFDVRVRPLKEEKGITYLILRPKQKLSSKQLSLLDSFAKNQVGGYYSKLKVAGMLQNKLKKKLFSVFSTHKEQNTFNSFTGHFCSELVVRAYISMDIQIGNTNDPSLISPLEVFNSAQLECIGYLDKF